MYKSSALISTTFVFITNNKNNNMNFKDLYKVIALTYCARVQGWGEKDEVAKNLFWWLQNMGILGKQISNYPNHGDPAMCLANDLYKAGLDDNEVFTYLRSLRNRHKVILYDFGYLSKLPKIVF